jgi:low density lipoprotein receptor-related protein 5/6
MFTRRIIDMKNQALTRKSTLFIFLSVLLIFLVHNITYAQGSAKIYWGEKGKIRRANLDGSNVEDVLTELETPKDIALDIRNRKMYWVTFNFDHSKIYRANLDGSNIEVIFNRDAQIAEQNKRLHSPVCIAIDTNASKIYWGNWRAPWGISRADNDGSNIEDIEIKPVEGAVFGPRVDAESIELDVKAGKMYFVDSLNDNIARVNFDGSNYEHLGISVIHHVGLALDLYNRYVYWTDPFNDHFLDKIKRSFLNGDNVETLLTELNRPTYIALDPRSRKMYWVERDIQNHKGKIIHKGKIRQANLDGSNVTDIFTGPNYVTGIALDTEGVYDVTPTTNKLTTTWANMKTK